MKTSTTIFCTAALLCMGQAAVSAQPVVLLEDARLSNFTVEPRPNGLRVSTGIPKGIAKGETLLLQFSMRSKVQEVVDLNVTIDPGANPYSKPVNMPASAGSQWRHFHFPFAPRRGYAPGEATLAFSGKAAANAEIRDVQLLSYGTTKHPWNLPITKTTYSGGDANAEWRKAAERRIDQIRKADLKVIVLDRLGKPVPGARIEANMRKHAFGFGSAVGVPSVLGNGLSKEDAQRYKDHVTTLFNKAVIENHLKWPLWARTETRPATMSALQWLKDSGLVGRGHVLVWPSWKWNSVPATMAARNNPPALAKAILDRIQDTVSATRGQLAEWDVLNEPYDNHDFIDILGKQAMVEWFKAARKADPDARLYINDYNILSGEDAAHRDHYFETIRFLLDNEAPLDGIGLQSHFPARLTSPEEILRRLDRFAGFGRDLQITEFDVDTIDEQTQAEFTRDFLTLIFSHPAVKGFMMWGFWESAHWKPDGAMIRADWSLKPNGHVYKDLVLKQWWTRAQEKTADDGTCAIRGFLGDYEVKVHASGQVSSQSVRLEKNGTAITFRLE